MKSSFKDRVKALASVSSGGSAFRHNIRRARKELNNPDYRKSDLANMIRGVQGLTVVLALCCAAILIAYSSYATTLNSYGQLLLSQGLLVRTARMATKAFTDVLAYNLGLM